MSAAVIFRWDGPENRTFQGEGSTRDMSVDGVFVLTATCPPAHAEIQLEVILPLSDGVSKAQMKADLIVLRVDHEIAGGNRSGFSALGKGFLVKTFSDRASRVVDQMIRESETTAREQE